jgi:hypothetical protein
MIPPFQDLMLPIVTMCAARDPERLGAGEVGALKPPQAETAAGPQYPSGAILDKARKGEL